MKQAVKLWIKLVGPGLW